MNSLVYLHGFRSSPASIKAMRLRDYVAALPQKVRPQLHIPDLFHQPAVAVASVADWVERNADPAQLTFVGSSLGGFYATHLAERFGARAVAINPAVRPYVDLKAWQGVQTNLYTGAEFTVTPQHFVELEALAIARLTRPERYFLLVEAGDEVLDYRAAVAHYGGAFQYVRGGGDHTFTEFTRADSRDPAVRRGRCMRKFEVAVIGGGLVGAAIAFGLRDLGARLALLDEGDVAHRAARGNFGLIWVQGKGFGMPQYGAWTQRSAQEWPRLAAQLREATGLDVALRQAGGLHVCLSRDELDARAQRMAALVAQPDFARYPIEVLDRQGVVAKIGPVGAEVAGATYSALDGDCNPLRLLRALHAGVSASGGVRLIDHAVTRIESAAQGFVLHTARGPIACERVVLAAGLANARLAPMVGLAAPVSPNQGHIVVLERMRPFLPLPLETVRQTDEGTVLIGDAQRDRGLDDAVDTGVLSAMAQRALRVFPFLRDVRVTRTWAALRVMSPDGFPIYEQSRSHPGAFVAACHSGVTLAAVHAQSLAAAIRSGALPAELAPFTPARFDVRAAA